MYDLWKPKLDVKMSIFNPSISVQEFDFALKSPKATIKYEFLSAMWSKFHSKLFKNVSNSLLFWLGDL